MTTPDLLAELGDLARRRRSLVDELFARTREQEAAVAGRSLGRVLELLAAKQPLVDEVTAVTEAITAREPDWRQRKQAAPGDPAVAAVAAALSEGNRRLEELVTLETEVMDTLRASQAETSERLEKLSQGRPSQSAYRQDAAAETAATWTVEG